KGNAPSSRPNSRPPMATFGLVHEVASAAAMADIEPFRALRYDLEQTGGLQDVVAPPYDVIDADQRAELEGRSPYNVVRIDLPQGEDAYAEAARILADWRAEGAVVEDD